MSDHSPRICLCCKEMFTPSPHAPHAQYCAQIACRKASKRASQARWLNKPENRDYFCGPHHVERVRKWRKAHPGYWRRPRCRSEGGALQDSVALQDLVRSPAVAALVGFLATQTDQALQETVSKTFWNMHFRGQAIMGMGPVVAPRG
jgi:hypothetical protein